MTDTEKKICRTGLVLLVCIFIGYIVLMSPEFYESDNKSIERSNQYYEV